MKENTSCFISFILLFLLILSTPLYVFAEEEAGDTRVGGGEGSGSSGAGGASNVNFTGTASYSIPIAVPPGRLGVAPNISLNYGSQGGNGPIGVGWDIDLGSIQRNAKNGVVYGNKDFIYTKNGSTSELIELNPRPADTPAECTGEYRSKIEDGSFIRFCYIEPGLGSPYWVAYDKNGMKYYFGQSSTSRQSNPSSIPHQMFQWKLDRIVDSNGNFMTLSYFSDSGQIYLEEINYTGNDNTNLQTTKTVRFNYALRPDVMTSYIPMFEVTTRYILDNIETRASGQLAGRYQFSYFQSEASERSMLEQVTRIGSDDSTTLPSTVFSYDTSFAFQETPTTIEAHLDHGYGSLDLNRVKQGDFNGDGKNDFLYIGLSAAETKFYISNGDSFSTVDFPFDYYDNFTNSDWKNFYLNRFILSDFNGDGKTDFIVIYTGAVPSPNGWLDETQANQLWLSRVDNQGELFFVQKRAPGFPRYSCGNESPIAYWDGYMSRFKTGDFNGDGKGDILFIDGDGGSRDRNSLIYLSSGTGEDIEFLAPQATGPLVSLLSLDGYPQAANGCTFNYRHVSILNQITMERIRIADFNGDGKTDIHVIKGADTTEPSILYFSQSTDTNTAFTTATGPSFFVSIYEREKDYSSGGCGTVRYYWSFFDLGRIRYGDFNGDKRTDILEIMANAPSNIYYGTGDPTAPFVLGNGPVFPVEQSGTYPYYYTQDMVDLSRIKLGDFNGDGKTDFMRVNAAVVPQPVSIFIANGSGYTERVMTETSFSTTFGSYNCFRLYATLDVNKFILGDFRGNGKTGFLYYSGDFPDPHLSMFSVPDTLDLMREVTLPAGGRITYDYTYSSDFPNTQLPFSLPLLTSLKVFPEITGYPYTETRYEYADGYFDFEDREFRGFGNVKQINNDGATLETWYHQRDEQDAQGNYIDDEDYKGKPYLMVFTQPWQGAPVNGQEISVTSNVWSRSTAKGIYPVFINITDKVVDHNFYNGVDAVTILNSLEQFVYDDSNGTITQVFTSATDYTLQSQQTESITTNNIYANYGFWLWRNTKTTVTGSTSGKVRETISDYYPTTGNLRSKEFWLSTGTNPKISYTYHPEGNLWTTTDAMNHSPITIVYDNATKTYPYTVTNSLGHTITTQYDDRFGTGSCSWDVNDNKTCIMSDPFGRPLETTSYILEGTAIAAQTKVLYSDVSAPSTFPRYTKTSVLEKTPGIYIEKWDFMDGLGRGIETITKGEGGVSIVSRTFYDNMGRPYLSEGPFYGSGFGFAQTSPASGYPWTETEFDYLGRPVSVTSVDGTLGEITSSIAYNGLNTKVTDADGKVKEEQKDYLGRIIWVKEYADSGVLTTRYEYNAAGDLENVIDNAGNTTTMHYDSLGRKINMTDPDMGYWQYRYDANGNLCKQSDAKNQLIHFEYDALKRVTNKTYYLVTSPNDVTNDCNPNGTSIPNETPVVYTYDELSISNGKGRLFSVTDNRVTSQVNFYDSLGRATSTTKTIEGHSYTTTTGYDYAGKVKTITYPDGYVVTYNYIDGTGLLSSVSGSDGTVFATFTLFEATGKIGNIGFGNGAATRYTYDKWSGRLTGMVAQPKNPTTLPKDDLFNMAYYMSGAGDISNMIDYKMGNTLGIADDIFEYTYTYDNLHRLQAEQTSTIEPSNTIRPADIEYVAHPTLAHAFECIVKDGVEIGCDGNDKFDYDDNGNMTRGWDISDPDASNAATRNIVYNAVNMPVQITYNGAQMVNFLYDASGRRARKSGGINDTYYAGKHYEVINGTPVKYIFAGGLRIAMMKGWSGAEQTYYFHKDHLGSTIALTNVSGIVVWAARYEPYGGFREVSGALITNYLYTDQEFDPETGLYYYGARYYDPTLGKFISPDSIIPNPFNPQTLNRYAYALNNPLRYVDPNGHEVMTAVVIGVVVGVVMGAAMAGYNSGWDTRAMIQGAVIGGVVGGVTGAVSGGIGDQFASTWVYGALAGAAGGAVGGALGALLTGGDILEGALYGAAGGAIGGAVGVGVNGYGGTTKFIITVATAGVVSGTIAEMSGASFSEGAIPGMIGAAMGYGLGRMINGKNDEKGINTTGSGEQEKESLEVCSASNSEKQVRSGEESLTRRHGKLMAQFRKDPSSLDPWKVMKLITDALKEYRYRIVYKKEYPYDGTINSESYWGRQFMQGANYGIDNMILLQGRLLYYIFTGTTY